MKSTADWSSKGVGSYATRSDQIALWTPRLVLRHLSLSLLATSDRLFGKRDQWLRRHRIHFVYLHSVFADEEEGFRSLLTTLSKGHRLIGYSEAVSRVWSGQIDEPYIAFSFDDGLENCMTAAEILREFGVTGCFFVCPAIVGEKSFERVTQYCRDRLHLPPVDLLSWRDLEELRKAGHEVGSHTLSHPNLAAIPWDQVVEEVEGSRQELVRRLGCADHFAWSYGRFEHFSPAARRAVFQAGYGSCASAERGCHVAASGPRPGDLCLRREHLAASWPLSHSLYFLAMGAKRASAASNGWPSTWHPLEGPER